MRKNVFYIHTNIVNQKGGKESATQVFQKHTNSACKKCSERKSRNNVQKRFLYSHEYRDQKMGEKTSETIFQKVTKSALKNVRKKTSEKTAKNVFYFHTNIITKTAGKKARETIFSETHE